MINWEQYRGVIWDLDGTICNSEKLYRMGWREVMRTYGHEIPNDQLWAMSGRSNETNNAYINSFLQDYKETLRARKQREEWFFEAVDKGKLHFKSGAKPLLDWLYAQHYPMVLATSSPEIRGQKMVDDLNIAPYFKQIIYGDHVKHKKPHPEIYQRGLTTLDMPAKAVLAIEDSPSGVQSALSAGLRVAMVSVDDHSFENHPQCLRIDSIECLLPHQ